jgi:death-on-curing protein
MLSFRNCEVEAEYKRWISRIAGENESNDDGITIADVVAVHFLIVDQFYGQKEGLGGIGPKDIGLLSSAVGRQSAGFGGYVKWPTLEDKVATLLYGIVLNHPFHDANKRTAYLTSLYYLQKNGRFPRITGKQFEDFVVTIADKTFKKTMKYIKDFSDVDDGDIKYIANFIRSATRQIDRKDYTITFSELNRILGRFGYRLSNPQGNYIDVIHSEGEYIGAKVCQIGFPSWTKQVTRQAIKTVRTATGLTVLNGIDSQVFFNDVEPIGQLLAKYYEPLRRLADR